MKKLIIILLLLPTIGHSQIDIGVDASFGGINLGVEGYIPIGENLIVGADLGIQASLPNVYQRLGIMIGLRSYMFNVELDLGAIRYHAIRLDEYTTFSRMQWADRYNADNPLWRPYAMIGTKICADPVYFSFSFGYPYLARMGIGFRLFDKESKYWEKKGRI